VPVGSADNHRSDFMDAKWEKVSYRNGKADGVMEFIAAHSARNMKAVFLGKEYYYIVLESYDKQAVIDALALSKALTQKSKLEAEVQALKKKLNIT
jgi:AmiR/NasT family two-component response regulator